MKLTIILICCESIYSSVRIELEFEYLEREVSTGEGDGVEVDAGLQVGGTQHGDTLIESSLLKKKKGLG